MAQLIDQGETPADLVAAAAAYALQQEAKGSTGTQFVLSPAKFYGTGAWRGPFPLPAAQQTPKPESDYDRLIRLNGGRQPQREVIEHDANPIPIRLEG